MVKSMTGYGQSVFEEISHRMVIEVRSLNSKFLDLNLRIPKILFEKELEIRTLVGEKLERGKITINIEYQKQNEQAQHYNEKLFVSHYTELKTLAEKVKATHAPLFQLALEAPEVTHREQETTLTPEEWTKLRDVLTKALLDCDDFRSAEGRGLLQKLHEYCNSINECIKKIKQLDPSRVEKIHTRLKSSLQNTLGEEGFDKNRLEQEIIFYVERLDIQEEIVRLETHLTYFDEVLRQNQSSGKKLGFIAQEIGREINTIGSKCNDAEIQKLVVLMKDELEKIKEQLNNIL